MKRFSAAWRRWLTVFLLLMTISVGVIGFMITEKFGILDAFYMTIITLSTVGFGEVHALSSAGKIFTSAYIILNLIFFAYLISTLAKDLFEGEFHKIFSSIMTDRELKKIRNHIILVGFGRNGRRAALELFRSKKKFIIIEKDDTALDKSPNARRDYSFLMGDATQDEVLKLAGITKAKTIITTLPSDSQNVFIALSARELNPAIQIISRASDEKVENKLMRAGANHVVMPDALGGFHMAHIVTKPFIVEFLEVLSGFGTTDYMLEEVGFHALKIEYREKTIAELDIRKKTGATILGLKDPQKGLVFNPSPSIKITKEDVMIIIGKEDALRQFKNIYTRHFKLTPD